MTDIDAICVAIDGGDDVAILILADALEEAGDQRWLGLRTVVTTGNRPAIYYDNTAAWTRDVGAECCVGVEVFIHLPPGVDGCLPHATHVAGNTVWYPTRSAAYLALAAALIQEIP